MMRLLVVAASLVLSITALPVVDLKKDTYETVASSTGTPWLVEVYSGMCESCKAYEKVWHALETKLEGHAGFGLGRINMDDNLGSALAMKFDDLLAGGIPAVLWVADAAKPYAYTMVDKGNAKSGKELWQALKKAAPEAATIIAKKEL